MKKILKIILIVLLSFSLSRNAFAVNTYSIDLERDSAQQGYILDANQTGLDLSNAFTIELWIKRESNVTEYFVAKYYTAGNQASYQFYYTSAGNLGVSWNPDGIGGSEDGTTLAQTLDLGVWYHLAVTKSGVIVKFYLNGNQIGSDYTGVVTNIFNGTAQVDIGGAQNGISANRIDGLMDEVRIWNVARTQTEISANMNSELIGSESGLVAYWKFNNDALDETTNNNDLTLLNSPVYSTDIPSWIMAGFIKVPDIITF